MATAVAPEQEAVAPPPAAVPAPPTQTDLADDEVPGVAPAAVFESYTAPEEAALQIFDYRLAVVILQLNSQLWFNQVVINTVAIDIAFLFQDSQN